MENQVYSEEGYEDSAYDHGGYDKHGEHHEVAPGWEMTAVRLSGLAAHSQPDAGSNEEEPGEGDEEDGDGDDHNAEGSDLRAKAVAVPNANRTHHGTTNDALAIQKVSTNGKNQMSKEDTSGNTSKPTPSATLGSRPALVKSKRDSNYKNLTRKPFGLEQLHVNKLLRALKLKEKEHRHAHKRSKKLGREKKKNHRFLRTLKKDRAVSLDNFDIRENEIKQPKSRKEKKTCKKQKREKRMKASKIKRKRNKYLGALSLSGESTHASPAPISGEVKISIHPLQITKVTNKTDWRSLLVQETNADTKRARPLKSVMKNPFSMYHRDQTEAKDSLSGLQGFRKDALGPPPVGDITHSKLWELVSPWESYGTSKQKPFLHPDGFDRPLPIGLLASTDTAEIRGSDGLPTVLEPIRGTMQGFHVTTGRMGPWGSVQEQRVVGKLEKRSLSTTTKKPTFVLPGQGNLAGKFPKTEAILQMETRTLSKLRKTHNVKELPSNIKHVKPLIGVSSNKGDRVAAKQIKMKGIGKRPHVNYKKDFSGMNRDSLFLTEISLKDFPRSSTERTAVSKDRALYIANLTENYLTTKNFSWPPQVTLSPPNDTKIPIIISQEEQKAVFSSPKHTLHKKMRRNVGYQTKKEPNSLSTAKFKRDNELSSLEHSPRVHVDDKKYPFYFTTPSEHLTRYSPLRYAINPSEIPVKTGGGMEFYESREKYKKCKEVEPPEDPVPDRPSDGQWVQNNDGPDGPRISGLGEVINCLREKLFGKDPLDNPFFLETRVGLPAGTSLVGALVDEDGGSAPGKNDQFEFYRDIIGQIDKTALRPFKSDVTDSPYVYIGSKTSSDSEEAQRSPANYASSHFSKFNLHTPRESDNFFFGNERNTPQKILAAQLEPKDVSENGEKSERTESGEDPPLPEPKVNQQYFNPYVAVYNTAVDPHTPLKMSEDSKKYLDDFLDHLVKQKDSKEELSRDRSQTDAQETKMRIAHIDSIYQPAVATKMHPPALSKLKYKSIYPNNFHPHIRLGPSSHEKLLSWPKAKYVLRDIGAKQEVLESSESKDPIRSQIKTDSKNTVEEQKKIIPSDTTVQSSSFNFEKPLFTHNQNPMLHPSKTAEVAKQQQQFGATKEPPSVIGKTQATTPSGKSEIELIGKDVHEPSASVITPLSTSHPPRLPEPIYHAVRGVGGIKAYHVGMQDDSVIEIPTPEPKGNQWRYKPAEQPDGTELSAQQSDEGEQQASNEPDPQEEQAPKDDNDAPNDSQNEEDDDHNHDGNPSEHEENNASGNKNENNNASEDKKNDENSDRKQNGDNQIDVHNDDENEKGDNEDDDSKPDKNEDDDAKPDKNEDDDAKPDQNEAVENDDDNEKEEDKSNNNGKPDFDEWFKESPYKVDDKDDYNVDWDDPKPKFRIPFSKEWHKELGGINDEFKDDKDNDDDGVGKHVEKLFDDEKGHDAYPDINTEPPAPASGEAEQGDGTEAENQEASQQDPHQDTSAQNSPSNEDNKAASPEKADKDQASATEEAGDDKKQSPKEDDDGSNAAEENISPAEDDKRGEKRESEEPTSNEEPASADEPKTWKSSKPTRRARKKVQDESIQETPSQESGGTGNEDGYDPAGYEKPEDGQGQSDEAGTEESQQSPRKAKVEDAFWSDKDDFGAPPGAKIRVVEHDASFGDMDDFDDDDASQGGKRTTRRGKNPDNLSITTTNSQVRSKGFDTGINKRRATSHQKKAKPVVENIDNTSSGEDMDGDFATNPKVKVPHPVYGNSSLSSASNVTNLPQFPLL